MALSEIEKYQRKLKRLIKNVPNGYKLVYDAGHCEIYVVDQNAEFFYNEYKDCGSTSPPNGLCSMSASSGVHSSDTGNDRDKVVGEGIFVTMEAVQQ